MICVAEFWGFAPCEGSSFFASYNSLDWQRIAPIARGLMSMGYPVWYDMGLQAGTKKWREQISLHIDSAYAVILFVTNGIFAREESYVINEYEEAKGIGKVIIPVFLDSIELYNVMPKYRSYVSEWKQLQCVMCHGEDAAATAGLIAGIINRSGIRYSAAAPNTATQQRAYIPTAGAYIPPSPVAPSRVSIGSRVAFGSYPQSSNTPEPIMWRVLDIIDGKALMISESLLDCKKYNEIYENVTWETCTLRRWLNGEFMSMAFSTEERTKLCRARINNSDNSMYGIKGGNPTEDYVFCLSIDEAKKYFGGNEDRKAKPTAFARQNGCRVSSDYGTCRWWLRSPGRDSLEAARILADGSVSLLGYYVLDGDLGVRPVVLARL